MNKFSFLSLLSAEVSGSKESMLTIRRQLFADAAYTVLSSGNTSQLLQAAAAADAAKDSKNRNAATLAKAYVAGLAAVGNIAPMHDGRADGKPTADKVQAMRAEAERLAQVFADAFTAAMPADKAPLSDAQRAENKAKKAAETEKAHAEWAQAQGMVKAETVFGPSAITDKLCEMILSGQLDGENVGQLEAAIKARKAAIKAGVRTPSPIGA